MSRSEIKYIALLLGIFALYVIFENSRPKPVDWRITLAKEDKIPFGTWVMGDILSDHFEGKVHDSDRSIYEIIDTLNDPNVLVLAKNFFAEEEDLNALLNWVGEGSTFFLASEYFGLLGDTLNLEIGYYEYFDSLFMKDFREVDSVFIRFVNSEIDQEKYWYSEWHVSEHFSSFDTLNSRILAVNWKDEPVMIETAWGEGRFILSSTPMVFTNYNLLKNNNHQVADYTASYLEPGGIHWAEYYQSGRREAMTPLRFVLGEESLRWGYYVAVFSILLFILFRIKRKQRIIPIILPLRNATRDFTKTVGNLYLHHNDHKNAVEKKINYFFEFIRSHYLLNTSSLDEEFYERLSHKSGLSREKVDHLFKMIIFLQSKNSVSKGQLFELNTKIDEFYMTK